MTITTKDNQIILKNGKHFYEKEQEIDPKNKILKQIDDGLKNI